jgi:hypothetical protein
MFRDGQYEVDASDVVSLGIDYVGYQRFDGEILEGASLPYGIFLITYTGELYLLARSLHMVSALEECEKLINEYEKLGFEWNVLLSDGCRIILQCSFMAGKEWSEDWLGNNSVTHGGDDDE